MEVYNIAARMKLNEPLMEGDYFDNILEYYEHKGIIGFVKRINELSGIIYVNAIDENLKELFLFTDFFQSITINKNR